MPRQRHELRERLIDALVVAEVDELDLPHIVVCCDLDNGAIWYFGPFESATEALVAAAREELSLDVELPRHEIVLRVAPLLEPGRRH